MNQQDKQFLTDLKAAERAGLIPADRAAAARKRFRQLQRATPFKQRLAQAVRNAAALGDRKSMKAYEKDRKTRERQAREAQAA